MKKFLIITNLGTLAILLAVAVRHFEFKWRHRNPVPNETVKGKTADIEMPCLYSLQYFDFHYERETENPTIIMLGNSLIRRCNWDRLLGRKNVINRGISGDHLPCICERLKYLKDSPAKIIFIEGGINDLPAGNTDTLFEYYAKIVNFWKEKKKDSGNRFASLYFT